MFGLSHREVLQKTIKEICVEQKEVYRKPLVELNKRYMNGEFETQRELEFEVFKLRKVYLDAVRSRLVEKLNRPGLNEVIEECIEDPVPCGINELFSTNGMRNFGVPAGGLYAMCLYHKKRAFISDADENMVYQLDVYQDKIIEDAINSLSEEA